MCFLFTNVPPMTKTRPGTCVCSKTLIEERKKHQWKSSLLVNVFNPVLPILLKVNFLSQATEIWKKHT